MCVWCTSVFISSHKAWFYLPILPIIHILLCSGFVAFILAFGGEYLYTVFNTLRSFHFITCFNPINIFIIHFCCIFSVFVLNVIAYVWHFICIVLWKIDIIIKKMLQKSRGNVRKKLWEEPSKGNTFTSGWQWIVRSSFLYCVLSNNTKCVEKIQYAHVLQVQK